MPARGKKVSADRVITRDKSSGMIHLRLRFNGKLYVQEGCNTDDAGDFDILPHLPEDMEVAKFCRNDFPDMHDPRP